MRLEKACDPKTEGNITNASVKNAVWFPRHVEGLFRCLAYVSLAGWSLLQSAGVHADVLDSSLKVRFDFDAPPVGNVVLDSGPSASHSGTNIGATWITSDAGRTGVMHFEGLSTNRIVASAADLNSSVGTIAFWVRSLAVTRVPRRYAVIFDRRAAAGDAVYQDLAGHLANQARRADKQEANIQTTAATLTVEPQLRKGEVELTKVPKLHPHHQAEYSFDTSTDPDAWMRQGSNLHVAFGSTDELYLRCEVPALPKELRIWEASGWKRERLNAQLLVWSGSPQEQVRVKVSELRSEQGKVISKERNKLSLVRYVLSNLPYQARGFDCGDATQEAAYLMPDRLEPFERFDLPARTVRPLWLSFDIPVDAEPGDYTGSVKVQSSRDEATLRVTIHVQAQSLPLPQDWRFRLDLWQNPWVVASYFQVEPWSEEHKLLLKKHLKLYAEAGGKYITTYAVHSPWSDNSYALEGTMIGWLKTAGGSWKFDYSVFDQYVELAMDAGVREAITIYTPIPWGNQFRYLDERSGNWIYEVWSPNSAEFKAVWNVFLDDLKAHLQLKGWFGKAYLGINENPLELTLAAAKVIKEHSKEWKITYAGDWHAELASLLDDYSTIITREPGVKELQERARNGLTTTYYVCCTPPQPNNFVFSAPVEGRYIGWYAAAYGYNGFLRWAYDAWPADPMRDARHTLWPAGDCFLVYPGGNSSIRFEKLREGIVDYEKILLLRRLASGSSDRKTKDLMKQLGDLLNGFAVERDYSQRDYDVARMTAAIVESKRLIEVLSAELGK